MWGGRCAECVVWAVGTFTPCITVGTISAMVAKPSEPTERIHIEMPKELIERIDDFRFERRLPSRAEAIRQLIEAGLRHAPKPHRPS
jgi:hypothetical protein